MHSIRKSAAADAPALLAVWQRSVEATHTFLSAADIESLKPEVAQALALPDVWVVESSGVAAGFMIMNENMIEALFISPDHMGQRLGTRLIEHAHSLLGPEQDIRVDVNEANPAALAFYLSRGFREISRSPTDASGRPWPILHLAMPGRPS